MWTDDRVTWCEATWTDLDALVSFLVSLADDQRAGVIPAPFLPVVRPATGAVVGWVRPQEYRA